MNDDSCPPSFLYRMYIRLCVTVANNARALQSAEGQDLQTDIC